MKHIDKIKIPKAEYHIGTSVTVRPTEMECPPFEAVVIGISCGIEGERAEYTVSEHDGNISDGWDESYMSPSII